MDRYEELAVAKKPAVRIGTSGWIYKQWRGLFYPERLPVHRWFAYYSQAFDTVEINNTFYRLPAPEAFDTWRQQAPPGFLYAIKASRFLTHMKKLKDPEEPLDRILGRCRRLGPFLGPVLYQLPPRWRCDVERLRQFIALLPYDIQHVFEFRDPSWYREDVRALLTETGMSFCIHDMGNSVSPLWLTGPIAYVRFHGSREPDSGGNYRVEQLRPRAEHIRSFQKAGSAVYVYFNNDGGGYALTNACQLETLLGMEPAHVSAAGSAEEPPCFQRAVIADRR